MDVCHHALSRGGIQNAEIQEKKKKKKKVLCDVIVLGYSIDLFKSGITPCPMQSLPYLVYDNVDPAMANIVILSSMYAFDKINIQLISNGMYQILNPLRQCQLHFLGHILWSEDELCRRHSYPMFYCMVRYFCRGFNF